MAEEKRNHSSTVGIDEFHYAILQEDTKENLSYGEIYHVPFSQEVSVETEQEIAKGYGDNVVAEMAVSTGVTALEMGFHALPLEDRERMLGLEKDGNLTIQKGSTNPPYVAVALRQVKADGTSQWVGLTKGIFTIPSIEAQTKEDSIEFSTDTIEGEFSTRLNDDIATIFAFQDKDDAGEARTEFFNKLFAKTEEGEEGAEG